MIVPSCSSIVYRYSFNWLDSAGKGEDDVVRLEVTISLHGNKQLKRPDKTVL
jgi:hypothetical protein